MAVAHHEDLREDAHVPDHRQRRQHDDDGLEDRQGDEAEDTPGAGAVEAGRLLQLLGHLREAGTQRDDDEGHGAPDDQQDDHGEALGAAGEPVVADHVDAGQPGQQPVEYAVVRVEEPLEDGGGHDDGHAPARHQRDVDQRLDPAGHPLEQQGDQHADDHRQDHGADREDRGPHDDGPELTVPEDRGEVAEADRLRVLEAPQLRLPELLEGERDQPHQRIAENQQQDEQAGREQQPGHPGPARCRLPARPWRGRRRVSRWR